MVCRNGSVRIASDKPVSSRHAVSRCGRKKPLCCYTRWAVDECHRQATRCFNPVDPELDPSSCGNARAAPSTRAGRERGRNGTGRTLAFSPKKKNKLWIWLAFDRSGQRLVDWECGDRDAATLNRLLERLTTSSAGAQAQRSKTLERQAVLYRRLCALRHAPAGWATLYRQG